ncbi:MAG TPA: MarR family winged helix-turn-helix transcriptional regulator [Tepidisphaeraceae bacterium]|jgi:DNA-binding MarR family transcriptional regulator
MGSHINDPRLDDARRVMNAVRRIVQALRIASRATENRFGVSAAQLFVLQRLAEGGSASVNELAARTLTHQSSVSVVVQRLEERGLVERATSPTDARRTVLSLTTAGRSLVRKSPQAAQERLIAAIKQLPAGDRRTLAALMERVAREALGEAEPPPLFFEDSHKKRRRRVDATA